MHFCGAYYKGYFFQLSIYILSQHFTQLHLKTHFILVSHLGASYITDQFVHMNPRARELQILKS
jgi:hypothetical protein